MQHGALSLCSLLAATSQFSAFIGHKMQLTCWHNGTEVRNVICVDTQTSIECPHCPLLITVAWRSTQMEHSYRMESIIFLCIQLGSTYIQFDEICSLPQGTKQ